MQTQMQALLRRAAQPARAFASSARRAQEPNALPKVYDALINVLQTEEGVSCASPPFPSLVPR
jgi:hypothetical protein